MTAERELIVLVFQIPHFDGAVPNGARDKLSIRADCHAIRSVTSERQASHFVAGFRLDDSRVSPLRNQQPAVWQIMQRVNKLWKLSGFENLFASTYVPDSHAVVQPG